MTLYWLGTMIDTACIFMFAALGDTVALMAGEYNLGGDGQIYAGAFTAAIVLNATRALPATLSLSLSLLCAAAAVCIMASLCILLKAYHGVSILLTTYIVSSAAIPVLDALISGRCRGEGYLLATPFIRGEVSSMRIMPPSSLSIASLFAPVLCVMAWQYLKRSEAGKRLLIVGTSNRFADYAGLKSLATSSFAVLFAFAMHAAAGFVMVVGTHRACIAGFQSGVGWSALTVSLLARRSVIGIIPCALLFSAVITFSQRFMLMHVVGFDASGLIQGLSIALIAILTAKCNEVTRARRGK